MPNAVGKPWPSGPVSFQPRLSNDIRMARSFAPNWRKFFKSSSENVVAGKWRKTVKHIEPCPPTKQTGPGFARVRMSGIVV